ncbi:MAG: transketolase [Bacteroidetes bacterium CG18_big_fil_WC_8_21_14_2_50_41_14]|nr:MAG: transketolase [Bacteroidetes bacterium CG18_big_fil_WC_8_21_14_2_50_41_14]PJB54991.1 MAG: transketolase [Bacteroidetes bacterium CG_4_9_14_3_um_filter_41_19]
MSDIEQLEKTASQVRRDIIRMVHAVQSGHPGGSLGCTDLFTALFFEVMDIHPVPFNMDGIGEDVLIVSNGHISPAYYSVMARRGYFPVSELSTFRRLHSRLQGHPATIEKLPGVRVATGSLGQGLSVATGIALSKKMNHDPHTVFCLMGDGELGEGQVWEAALYGGAHQINNLVGIIDYNGKQIDGPTDKVLPLGDLRAKFEAFGWKVTEMNGNKMDEVVSTLKAVKSTTGSGKPNLILMHTEMGMGVDFMMGTHKWHGTAPNDQQKELALSQLKETLGDY